MSDPILLLNTQVEIQSVLGSAKTITGISKASEAVVTATHDFQVGDIIVIDNVVGMTQINRRAVRVGAVNTTVDFTCEDLDSTNWTTWASGGTASKVTTFLAFDTLTTFNYPEPQPNPISVTTIHDNEEKEVFGLDSAPTATMDSNAQPLNASVLEVRKASLAKTDRVIRVTFQNGNVMLINAKLAGGRGVDGSAGEVAKSQISLKFRATEQVFAS